MSTQVGTSSLPVKVKLDLSDPFLHKSFCVSSSQHSPLSFALLPAVLNLRRFPVVPALFPFASSLTAEHSTRTLKPKKHKPDLFK